MAATLATAPSLRTRLMRRRLPPGAVIETAARGAAANPDATVACHGRAPSQLQRLTTATAALGEAASGGAGKSKRSVGHVSTSSG